MSPRGVVIVMHPFYGPSQRLMADRDGRGAGIASMAAYLAFWAVVVGVAKRELDLRWPRTTDRPYVGDSGDSALQALRLRFAQGEIDRGTFLAMRADLTAGSPSDRPS